MENLWNKTFHAHFADGQEHDYHQERKTKMANIKIELQVTAEEGIKVLEAMKNSQTKVQTKGIDKWPYWCWNCHIKIESPPKPDARGDMICPSCGLKIPEP